MVKQGSLKTIVIDGEEVIAECVWLAPLSNSSESINGGFIERIDPETGNKIICRICYGI